MSNSPVIHWFRLDLRLNDNPGLHHALHQNRPTVPVFILDGKNAGEWSYGGAHRWWLHHSLKKLKANLDKHNLPLIIRAGRADDILPDLVDQTGAKTVTWNRCYEPWRIKRDKKIKAGLEDSGIEVESFNGRLLIEPWEIKTKSKGTPYTVYTPYWRRMKEIMTVRDLVPGPSGQYTRPDQLPDSQSINDLGLLPHHDWVDGLADTWTIGEDAAHNRLEDFLDRGAICRYDDRRDYPSDPGTSRMSPHLHWGEISPVQIWHRVKSWHHQAGDQSGELDEHVESYLSELGWREFSYNLLYHFNEFPDSAYRDKFLDFPWRDDPDGLQRWQDGQTGYPMVDAGMRQLYEIGWMHNRLRMIVGSFLVKDLLIHWKEGEKWFWDCLVDGDLASNSAGWQWVAGSGADAAPYFRIFNPVTQSERFDPSGDFIRKYVPELADLPDDAIHAPWQADDQVLKNAGIQLGVDYPHPIVDHSVAREKALSAYETIK
jgi:deoxyribodipyrimidine photo-lyase